MRVLVLNADLPIFPGGGGVEYLHMTRLAASGTQVGLVSMVHTPEHLSKKDVLEHAGVRLYVWQNPLAHQNAPAAAVHVPLAQPVLARLYTILRTRPHRPRDTIVQDFQFRNIADPLLDALSGELWNTLVVVQSGSACWLDNLPELPLKVLVMHDIRSLVYERRARTESTLLRRVGCWVESRRYRRFERRYCQQFDLVVTVSADDEAWVRRNYQPRRVTSVPIPVDSSYFAPMAHVPDATTRIVFTGMMNHPPNIDAVCFFAMHVLPHVRAAIPKAEFWIVGRDPAPEVQDLTRLPGVTVTGFIEDIRPQLAQAAVVVVPLRFGSGMRQKILEAWAMQKCVVSTTIGAEGLQYQNGLNLLIADGVDAFANAVIQSLRDPDLRRSIAHAGRETVLSQHDPESLNAKYRSALRVALRERRRMGRMRVVVDLRWMKPGLAGGIENHTKGFLNELLSLDHTNQYTLLLPLEATPSFDFRFHRNVRMIRTGGLADVARLGRRGLQLLQRRLSFADWRSPAVETLRRARSFQADVGLSMPGYIHPDLHPLLNVLVMPDVQHEYFPQFFSRYALEERKRLYADSVQRARHICANSEFTRRTLIERLEVPPQKVTVTYLGADPIFGTARQAAPAKVAVLNKYGLRDRSYIFFPANTWWHKNHRTLVDALAILHGTYGLDPLLVCTGGPKEAQAEVEAAIAKHGLEQQVRFLGYCNYNDLPGLYEGAVALVYPSLFEGFGMPVLEAMTVGCPVVCSDTTSLPEVAGDAALLVDPSSPEHLADGMAKVLEDSTLRAVLVERGHLRARQFSWRNYAVSVARILHEVWESRFE